MSFLAKLVINGLTMNVLHTDLRFYQPTDRSTFKPLAMPNGGLFSISLETTTNTDLLRLTTAENKMCNGYVRFYKRDGHSKLMDYEFFDTYIVNLETEFTASGLYPMTDIVIFSPGILRIGDMVFQKHWKVTDLASKDLPTQPLEPKKNPSIEDYYITDSDGNRIESATAGQMITLNIKTQDMIGEIMEIDLNDQEVDFKYKGNIFEYDTLSMIL